MIEEHFSVVNFVNTEHPFPWEYLTSPLDASPISGVWASLNRKPMYYFVGRQGR